MRTLIIVTFAIISLLSTQPLLAQVTKGADRGSANLVIACSTTEGDIRTSFLFDFIEWQGKSIQVDGATHTINIRSNSKTFKLQLTEALYLFQQVNQREYEGLSSVVDQTKDFVHSTNGVKAVFRKSMKAIDGARKVYTDPVIIGDFSRIQTLANPCSDQTAKSYLSSMIYYDGLPRANTDLDRVEIYPALTDVFASQNHRAGAFAHEAIYRLLRTRNYTPTSGNEVVDEVRQIVAVLFSDLSPEVKVSFLSRKLSAIICGFNPDLETYSRNGNNLVLNLKPVPAQNQSNLKNSCLVEHYSFAIYNTVRSEFQDNSKLIEIFTQPSLINSKNVVPAIDLNATYAHAYYFKQIKYYKSFTSKDRAWAAYQLVKMTALGLALEYKNYVAAGTLVELGSDLKATVFEAWLPVNVGGETQVISSWRAKTASQWIFELQESNASEVQLFLEAINIVLSPTFHEEPANTQQ